MCGIAGIHTLKGSIPVLEQVLRDMTAALNHRGPDGSGMYIDDRIGLGHTRLSIIDLNGGAQPITNEDENLWIVFNGEIFNYPELREGLIARGHRFSTETDTEVILHLFEEQGPACLDSLNGQFAFAIWDRLERKLFLARDRFGILPLYYTVWEDRLLFASEIKSIMMMPGLPRQLDTLSIDQIFTFWTTTAGRTAFKDILEVPAGHYLIAGQGACSLHRYWNIPFASEDRYRAEGLPMLIEEIEALINDAVRIRLRADVPVGCYVSGGLDSSGITALVKGRFQNELRTFGIRFEEKAFDESDHQRRLVDQLGTVHTSMLAKNADIGALLDQVLWHCEKPLLRTAPVPLFQLSGAVRDSGYKVVLTGEGADEVFGGYDIFREAKILKFWSQQPDSKVRPKLFERIYPYIFQQNSRARTFAQSFFGAGLKAVDDPLFSHLVRWNATSRIKMFYSGELREAVGDHSCLDELRRQLPEAYGSWDYLSKAQYLEMSIFMSNYLLSSQGDRVSMAHSVEVRPPFLDHRIMEFMGSVPPKWRVRGLNEKYLLKKAFSGILPAEILQRQKHPYRAPIGTALLAGKSGLIAQYLSRDACRQTGLFDPGKVEKLVGKMRAPGHVQSEFDDMALAGILSTQIISGQFVDQAPRRPVHALKGLRVIDRRTAAARMTA